MDRALLDATRHVFHEWSFSVDSPSRGEVAAVISVLAQAAWLGGAGTTHEAERALWAEWMRIASAPLAVELFLSDVACSDDLRGSA